MTAPGFFAPVVRLLLLALGLGALLSPPAFADDVAPSVLIVDSSGSMAARLPDGRVKLDAARTVIKETLANWPVGGELAVVAYGHRRQSDCADIETLSPLMPVDATAIEQQLKLLMARGKTPISDSLRHAAALLPDGGGTIILVSDGIETCEADPCAVAKALKDANAEVFIHVVGLGLTEDERRQLACIPENTGGRFFSADDSHALAEALKKVKEVVAEPPPPALPPAPEPPPVQAETPPVAVEPGTNSPGPDILVRVNLVAVAGELGIVDAPARWRVTDGAGKAIYEGESRALTLDLPAGPYSVVVEAANAEGKADITTTGEPGQTFEVDLVAGRLDLALAATRDAEPFGDAEAQGIAWSVEPLDSQGEAEVPQIARPILLLAPGKYKIGASLKGMHAEATAEVAPGKAEAVTLAFDLGTVTLEAVLEGQSEPLMDATMLTWRIGEGAAAQTIQGQARPRVVLPAGKHPVVLTIAGSNIDSEVEVRPGEESIARIAVGGGELTLTAQLGPDSPPLDDWRDTLWTVAAANAPPDAQGMDLPVAQPVVPVPPGRWRISLKSGTVTAEKEVNVTPGAKLPVTVELGAAKLTARGHSADGAPPDNIVFSFTEIADDGGPASQPAFEAGATEELSTIVKAGRWRISAVDSNGRTDARDITLKAGEEQTLELTLK
jgi:Ca-activated chloride channel family protein